MVVKGILKESREYYLDYKKRLVSQLLQIPYVGFLRKRQIKGAGYVYLQRRGGQGGKLIEKYLGKSDDALALKIQKQYSRREKLIMELKTVKKSLKELGVKAMDINTEDFMEPVRKVLEKLNEAGLWEEGLELVGSWCFKLYQEYLGVERFPLRTIDIDIAIQMPYKGKKIDIGEIMKSLGFSENLQVEGIPVYEGNGIRVEFHTPLKGKGANGDKRKIDGLNISVHALRYLDILMENPLSVMVRDVGRVSIPSPAAFIVHKLLVAPTRKEKGKTAKDYIQIFKTMKLVVEDEKMMESYKKISSAIPGGWQKKLDKSIEKMKEYLDLEDLDKYDEVIARIL